LSYLIDTNILLRTAEPNHEMYSDAVSAVSGLIAAGENVVTVPQCLIEFWVVATRPTTSNGLEFSIAEADAEVERIGSLLTILPERPDIFDEWRLLVAKYSVRGRNAHDARIAAAMVAHGVENIVTFNHSDFRRYTEFNTLTPSDVISEFTSRPD